MAALIFLAPALAGSSQAALLDDLGPGSRVRATLRPDQTQLVGTWVALDEDSTLHIVQSGYRKEHTPQARTVQTHEGTSIPFGRISRLERSIATHRHTKLGAYIGVAAGCIAQLAISDKPRDSSFVDFGTNHRVPLRILTILGGGVIGAVVGSQAETDVWEEVPLR